MRPAFLKAGLGALASSALLTLAGLAPAVARDGNAFNFRVMTFNIRFDFESDGDHRWKNRADLVAECVKESKVSVVCFQEDKVDQDDDLKQRMKGWEWHGKPRAHGRTETCSVVFDTNVWTCPESGDFWLSDTPDVPNSNTWGTKYPHKVSWCRLESIKGHHQIMFTSTHLDEVGGNDEIRRKSAVVIREWLAKHCPKGEIISCGDFNSAVTDPSHAAMTAASPGQPMFDAFDVLHPPEPRPGTCHEFKGVAGSKRIDWILYSGKVVPQSIKIDRYNKDGRWPSDHFAVWAEFEVSGGESGTKSPAPEPQVK
jgi:endonuclease/exonuclease/phosphatase family metal-dependent hydrolase